MTRGTAARLLGTPEDRQRATFLDLLFDLVFVFALFQLSQGLLEHLNWSDAFQSLVLLLAVWAVWVQTVSIAGRYDPGRPVVQLLVIACMYGSFVLAAAVSGAFGARGLLFAGAYVVVQVGRGVFLAVVTWGDEWQRRELRVLFWSGVAAVPWLAGALLHGWARGLLWALALALDYTAARFGWPTPRLGRAPAPEIGVAGEFLADRRQQFFIIALGELIVVSGLAISRSGFGADHRAAAVVALTTTVLLWRIYIYRAGALFGAAVAAAHDELGVVVGAGYAHPVMVAGIVAISVGDELVIEHPFGYTQPAWIAVMLGGPALFLAGRAILEYTVFSRVSADRVVGVLVLAAISPAMILAPPLLVAIAAAVVLTGVAVADTAHGRRRPAEPPSPPGGPVVS